MARLSLSQSNAGRPPALSHADQLLVALQYWREYRIYFHIASDWNVSESTVCRIVQRVETALLDSRYFRLPGKKHLLQETERPDVIVIDVTETPIERPKTGQKAYYSGKKAPHAQMPNYGRPIHPSHYLSRVRLEFGKGRRHDFRLFKTSAIHLHPETESLQDSG